MSSTADTGHAKNLSNLGLMNTQIGKIGAKYKPPGTDLTLAALKILFSHSTASMKAVKESKDIFKRLSNECEVIFDAFQPFATRILGALAFCKASKQTMDDAMTIKNKITGRRATPKKDPTPEEIAAGEGKSISVSQKSADNIVDHFENLLVLVKGEPLYLPNEPELQIAALDYMFVEMSAKNTYAKNAEADLGKMLDERDRIFYAPETGLYDIAMAVKGYVRTAFGPKSIEYKQINALKFVSIKPRKNKKKKK